MMTFEKDVEDDNHYSVRQIDILSSIASSEDNINIRV